MQCLRAKVWRFRVGDPFLKHRVSGSGLGLAYASAGVRQVGSTDALAKVYEKEFTFLFAPGSRSVQRVVEIAVNVLPRARLTAVTDLRAK